MEYKPIQVISVLFVLCWLACPSCASALNGDATRHPSAPMCSLFALPRPVRLQLEKRLPGWHPVQLRDLAPEDQDYWRAHHPHWCPGIISGHFEAKPGRQWAVAVMRLESHSRLLAALVLMRDGRDRVHLRFLLRPARQGQVAVISWHAAGRYYDEYDEIHVSIPYDGVLLEVPEAASSMFYLDRRGRVKTISISL